MAARRLTFPVRDSGQQIAAVLEKAPAQKWRKASSKAVQSFCPFARRCSMVAASVKAMAAPRSNKARSAVSGSGSGGTQWGRSIKNQRLGPMLVAVLLMPAQ